MDQAIIEASILLSPENLKLLSSNESRQLASFLHLRCMEKLPSCVTLRRASNDYGILNFLQRSRPSDIPEHSPRHIARHQNSNARRKAELVSAKLHQEEQLAA